MANIREWWQSHRPTTRRLAQLYCALLYNANLKGFVKGEIYTGGTKVLCVPGFNCYSCPGAVGACPLGSLQGALASSGHKAPWYMMGILLLFGITLGRTICGWLCPLGLIQELLHKIPTPKIRKGRITRALSWLKYVVLGVFVIAIPLWYGVAHDIPTPGFCKYICPAGTLEGAVALLSHPGNSNTFSLLGVLFTRKFVIMLVIGLACIFCYRSFCRFLCPLGAIYGLFNRFAIIGIKVDPGRCNHCGACVANCGMDVRHVGDHECISCGKCMDSCAQGAISMKCGKYTLMGPVKGRNADSEAVQKKRRKYGRIAWAVLLAVLVFAVVWYNIIDVPKTEASNEGTAAAATVAVDGGAALPADQADAGDATIAADGTDNGNTIPEADVAAPAPTEAPAVDGTGQEPSAEAAAAAAGLDEARTAQELPSEEATEDGNTQETGPDAAMAAAAVGSTVESAEETVISVAEPAAEAAVSAAEPAGTAPESLTVSPAGPAVSLAEAAGSVAESAVEAAVSAVEPAGTAPVGTAESIGESGAEAAESADESIADSALVTAAAAASTAESAGEAVAGSADSATEYVPEPAVSATESAPEPADSAVESAPEGAGSASASTPAAAGSPEDFTSTAPVGAAVGNQLADFTCDLVGGGSFHLADNRGKVVVLNLWATYCAPCVAELPHFEKLAEEHPDAVVLAVHNYLVTTPVDEFLKNKGWEKIRFGIDSVDKTVLTAIAGSAQLPQTVVLNRKGEVIYNDGRSVSYELLETLLKKAEEG